MDSRIPAVVPMALLAIAACSQENAPKTGPVPADPANDPLASDSKDAIHITGTVRHLDIEGGVYVIQTDDGKQYRPIELPQEFRVDGLAIEADVLRRDDVLTADMAGQGIELLSIRRK